MNSVILQLGKKRKNKMLTKDFSVFMLSFYFENFINSFAIELQRLKNFLLFS